MLDNIKSSHILKTIFKNLSKRLSLILIINNKNLQKRLNISIDTYIKYSNQIEIDIIPNKIKLVNQNKFINIFDWEYKPFYHIYFNDGNEEIDRNYFTINENISKIKVLIDMEVKSIQGLFSECCCIKEIKFIKFNRTDFKNYKAMLYYCLNLINIDISKLKTNNVENMENMFDTCEVLTKLDLSNFNTDKVKTMYKMFNCCSSLKELNISNFKFNEYTNLDYMFSDCSINLKNEIKNKNKDIYSTAFDDYEFNSDDEESFDDYGCDCDYD